MSFIHEKALVEGKVRIGKNSSILAFAVVRGDENEIVIGNNTNIQEHCMIHGSNTKIGNNVTIGHNAVVHGARIGDNVLVGMGSIVLDDAEISDLTIIGAGALVPPGKRLEPGVYVGNPAKRTRSLTKKDEERIMNSYKNYLKKIKNKQ